MTNQDQDQDQDQFDLATALDAASQCVKCRHDGEPCSNRHIARATAAAERLVKASTLTPARKAHTLAVGRTADQILTAVDRDPTWKACVRVAATLHDIGYAHPATGMHAIDGAQWLQQQGIPGWICAEVAWHSTARFEVDALGLTERLYAFQPPDDLAHPIIWVADFTTSPTGDPVDVDARVAEIRSRYGPGSAVVAALDASQPALGAAVRLVRGLTNARGTRCELPTRDELPSEILVPDLDLG